MARRVETFMADYGRDAGKSFDLTEMPAEDGEWWALRALRALAVAGVDLPEDWENAAMATLMVRGMAALAALPEHTLKALMTEMFDCVRFRSAKGVVIELSTGANSQIEEVKTRWQIRKALWYLHTGFSSADELPNSE